MKIFLLFALSICTGLTTHAQSRLGVKAGATLTRYAGSGTGDIDPLAGFHAGVTYNLPISAAGFFSLQPELLYAQKGAKAPEQGNRVTSRLHYLDLPVLARLKAGGLVLEAGPQLGYLLGQAGDYKSDASVASYEKLDFGYVAGIGYQAAQGYNVGIRYNGGLSSLFSEVQGARINPRNSGFQFYAGYVFGHE